MRDVEIVLDKPRTLRFTIQALLDLQRASKEPLGLFEVRLAQVSVEHLTWAVWAGLKHVDARLTVERVALLLDKYLENGGTLGDLMLEVNKALFHSGLFAEPPATPSADPLPGTEPPPLP
jgi:hypothetical protein